jgi:hypothetical protein
MSQNLENCGLLEVYVCIACQLSYNLLTLGLKDIHLRNILQNGEENNSEKSCRSCSLSGWTTTRIDALLYKVSELHLSYVRGRG